MGRVSCGNGTTGTITEDGRLYMCGHGHAGRQGNGSQANNLVPTEVGLMATSVSSGDAHSLVLSHRGTVLAFGHGGNGRLGSLKSEHELLPTAVLAGIPVQSVSAGDEHSLALSQEGDVFFFGSASNGTQLFPDQLVPQALPRELFGENSCIAVSAGVADLSKFKRDFCNIFGSRRVLQILQSKIKITGASQHRIERWS